MSDTIAAISTGNQLSAIGIIRLSGDDAINIVGRVFRPNGGGSMAQSRDRHLVYGSLLDKSGGVIDVCLCTISRAPNSYTGENTAELQCHGSPVVLREALESLFAAGARQALAGEFTKRAFLNNRMDLTQAEAVIDLISAETAEAARNAAGQLGGAILRKTDAIYSSLIDIMSHYHAVLDYPDEEIEQFQLERYESALDSAEQELKRLLASFEHGRVMNIGVKSAIIGRPNVGKSSLLNSLLGYDRAIVTEVPGTTRDTIEERLRLGGVLLRLTDTAGLRGTDDPVERLGVERALGAADQAELVLAVFDGSAELTGEDERVISAAVCARRRIAVVNKSDLPQRLDPSVLRASFDEVRGISALERQGLDELEAAVASLFPAFKTPVAGEILTNARQADAVSRALACVRAARQAMRDGITPDAVLTETEGALAALGELTGKTVREDITARIFERFCVGK